MTVRPLDLLLDRTLRLLIASQNERWREDMAHEQDDLGTI